MGKIKTKRQKLHLSAKPKTTPTSPQKVENPDVCSRHDGIDTNVFSGLNIDLPVLLNQTLPKDFDVQSVTSTRSRKERKEEEKHLPKKEKIKLRHERFMDKIAVTQIAKKGKKKKKKTKAAQETSEVEISDEFWKYHVEHVGMKRSQPKIIKGGIKKMKERQQQHVSAVKAFRAIQQTNTFKGNPGALLETLRKSKVLFPN